MTNMSGTMDMKQLMNISNMMENMYEEEQQNKPGAVVLSCYGCEHMVASPLLCDHPNAMVVRWDPIRNRSYRMPSIELAVENGGVCKFFNPDVERGAGGWMKKRTTKIETRTDLDDVLDQLDDDNVSIEDFMKNLDDAEDKEGGDEGDDK